MTSLVAMRIIAYTIITVCHCLKWYGTCSDVLNENHSQAHLFNLMTTENFYRKEKLFYVERNENSTLEVLQNNLNDMTVEPVISYPVFENISWNASNAEKFNRRRDISKSDLSYEKKMEILQLHNIYRSNVTPPAGNMAFMEWDEELAQLAQMWADDCSFEHGMPPNDYPDMIGQNLYIGTDPTGYLGLWMWYEEHLNYDIRKQYCFPDEQCGHYVQMAWAASNKLGCGMRKCDMRFYLVCHYSPPALRGVQMYHIAKPCSQCSSRNGGLCLNNLCMTWKQCKQNPLYCQFAKCELECHNCGILDEANCLCKCADGWDSPDCSHLCEDQHKRCGKSPGWPTKAACPLNRNAVAEIYCRKMCEMCRPFDKETSNHTCCNGTFCDQGSILNPQLSCKCVPLCPGPSCDKEEEKEIQAYLHSSANYFGTISFVTLWIMVFPLSGTIRRKSI